jgi:transcription-repair coupling factor (superfamily II helicase)
MEIRGAGNLLGKQQSGHVAAVGFELFMQMMDEATAELRGQSTGPRVEPEIELGSEAYIPDHYIEDIGERLLVYKRLANVENVAALVGLADELADRFGPLPHQAEDFIRIMRLRPALKRLAIESLKASKRTVAVRFHEESPVDRERLVRLVTKRPELYGMRPGGGFTMTVPNEGWDSMVDEIEKFLDLLEADLAYRAEGAREEGSGNARLRDA